MTALQTFPATTSTGTTEVDHSHYGRGDLGFKDHRSFATMDQIRDEPSRAPSTEATSNETKNYGTIASTLHHLEQTEQVAAPKERSESIPQARLEAEDSAQATELDRRKDGEQEEKQQWAAGDADDVALPLSLDGAADPKPANNRKRKFSASSEREAPASPNKRHASMPAQRPKSPLHPPKVLPPIPQPADTPSQPEPSPPAIIPPQPQASASTLSSSQPPASHPSSSPPHQPPPSHLTTDLLSLFSLQPLVSSVARTNPTTGEKINKMRKSYEGHVKSFLLPGRNRAVKHDSTTTFSPLYKDRPPMRLIDMARWPDEEWLNQQVHGKDVRLGLSKETEAKLRGGAVEFRAGKVPESDKWEDVLGLEKSKPLGTMQQTQQSSVKGKGPLLTNGMRMNSSSGNHSKQAGMTINNSKHPEGGIRPRRVTKKRRYDDGSFEGYGEGFVDDELDSYGDAGGGGGGAGGGGGYSSAGSSGRRGSMHSNSKKRKMG